MPFGGDGSSSNSLLTSRWQTQVRLAHPLARFDPSVGGDVRRKNRLNQCFACLFEKHALSAAVRLVGLAGAVADSRQPNYPELAQRRHHVEDDARLARLVKLEAVTGDDVE